MTATPVLQINHLQKSFGHFQALKDITFNVNAGEVFGFIGPNGAGKSTTIRVLLGLIRATGGDATIFGQDVWHDSVAIHRRLAYVPGDVYLWPNLTGGEIIDLLLKMNGAHHSQRTDDLIKQFGLDPTKKARTYSKGNRQKVALIAAFSQDADFYIFDEPTSGLDPLNERQFQLAVLALKQQGKAVLLSSHILSEVERMCDRIAIIREGRIIETGSLAEMRHLTRTVINVTLKTPLDVAQLAGVHNAEPGQHANEWQFSVEAKALPAVMLALTEHHIMALQSTPPTLEDLFMHYYTTEKE
ncbi:ABC transporter ATP-binding protein [Levilactobacillus tujiorum]|uniref:ABC transporter ATP-binding protein n=1 Tax=Levilactobacillus tujiorum TaxID=2912243 RepID=A0ABX1L1T1_9LACO|nr:ABC transporter ATP-binding protein [Levilactobacillus tujiorum]MCH5464008.1 ABC transporter ATP-binding protein [Levilactobacillus tujiorum]NLR11110.1 ABC transporter ATP-binding protein [Lactobacillus sp. HBUAS51387]NLR28993.1 ABC transporter ATP-binding protein [Levilactobacillus tujiorum]